LVDNKQSTAATLIQGSCTTVYSGDTMTPTTAGVCYKLSFDQDSSDSTYTIDTTGVDGIVFAAEHLPTEFEDDTHYLYCNSCGDDDSMFTEPVYQEGGERYAYFDCNSDGSLVSYGEECSDDACSDCEVAGTEEANGACYMAGGYVHYATCDSTGTNVTVQIYETAGWNCSTDITGATVDQTHNEPAGGCKLEEHDHGGDDDTAAECDDNAIDGASIASASLAASIVMAAVLLLMGN